MAEFVDDIWLEQTKADEPPRLRMAVAIEGIVAESPLLKNRDVKVEIHGLGYFALKPLGVIRGQVVFEATGLRLEDGQAPNRLPTWLLSKRLLPASS